MAKKQDVIDQTLLKTIVASDVDNIPVRIGEPGTQLTMRTFHSG